MSKLTKNMNSFIDEISTRFNIKNKEELITLWQQQVRNKKKGNSSKKGEKVDNEAITLTFGDAAENHAGMQCIGTGSVEGYSKNDLIKMSEKFSELKLETKLYDLQYKTDTITTPEAYLLVIKNGVSAFCNPTDLFSEMKKLNWDKKAFMKGRVVNKHARYNLCFSDFSQESDYENKKGTVIHLDSVPILKSMYNGLTDIYSKNKDLQVEGNYYYDVTKCGIGFHGDSERKKVIGARLGSSIPLVFKWYSKFQPISPEFRFDLESGDLYVMCSKAVGTDWKKSSIFTLRHAAGSEKFIKEI